MIRESDILYQNGPFWVSAAEFGTGRYKPKSKGYEVWESGITHSTRRSIIGHEGPAGFAKARAEADRLANATK